MSLWHVWHSLLLSLYAINFPWYSLRLLDKSFSTWKILGACSFGSLAPSLPAPRTHGMLLNKDFLILAMGKFVFPSILCVFVRSSAHRTRSGFLKYNCDSLIIFIVRAGMYYLRSIFLHVYPIPIKPHCWVGNNVLSLSFCFYYPDGYDKKLMVIYN